MKRSVKLTALPLYTAAAGIIGFLLRLWQKLAGTEESGLLIPSHPARFLSIAIAVLIPVLLIPALRRAKKTGSYKNRFPRSVPAAMGAWIAAAGVLTLGITTLSNEHTALAALMGILSIPTALCLILTGIFRLHSNRPNPLFHGIVTVFFMVVALYHYPTWSAEPQLELFCYDAFACVFLILASYYRTTLDAKQQNWQQYGYFSLAAMFFCFLAIPGTRVCFYFSMLVWTGFGFPALRAGKDSASSQKPMHLPQSAKTCIRLLEKAGFEAYVVGGCVRDHLLGLTPHDYDLCTSATPEEICGVFTDYKLVRSGEKHGTIGVVMEDGVYEITTFRAEGAYTDNRHPDWVAFVTRLEDDLKRRDFTVNAMAYSPSKGFVDPYGGQQDLSKKLLRTVGDPEARFREDALRILRGVRFAARYQLTVEEETERAMTLLAPLMDNLARERVFDELCKFLPLATAEDMQRFAPVLTKAIPELAACVDFAQYSTHHRYDVYTHTAHVVESVSQDLPLRWAALLHDVGKPQVFSLDENGQGHFRGHASAGAAMADEILRRLKAPNALREEVIFLIAQHMTLLEQEKGQLLSWVGKYGKEAVQKLLALQNADFISKGTDETTDYFTGIQTLLDSLMEEKPCLTAKDLAVNGRDILALGVEPGPRVGECMRRLLALVQEETVENTKEALLAAAAVFLQLPKDSDADAPADVPEEQPNLPEAQTDTLEEIDDLTEETLDKDLLELLARIEEDEL